MEVSQIQSAAGLVSGGKGSHRLITGVAGSGKTLALVRSARLTAMERQHRNWNILLTYYTRALTKYMENEVKDTKIKVMTIGRALYGHWEDCLGDGSSFPDIKGKGAEAWKDMINAFQDGRLRKNIYDAIFVDEAQDLGPYQLECLRAMLNKQTDCAVFAYDYDQGIFRNRPIEWKKHGFRINNESNINRWMVNYRNNEDIHNWALYQVYGDNWQYACIDASDQPYHAMNTVCPRKTRHIFSTETYKDHKVERFQIVDKVQKLIENERVSPKQIAILHPNATEEHKHTDKQKQFLKDRIYPYIGLLEALGIPVYWISKDDNNKINFDPDMNMVAFSTPESAKGLEWDIVFLPSIDGYHISRKFNVLYVAGTRAKHQLFPSQV